MFRFLSASSANLRQGFLIIERLACYFLDVFYITNRHLCHGDGYLDPIALVQMDLPVLQSEKLRVDPERVRSICPGPDVLGIRFYYICQLLRKAK